MHPYERRETNAYPYFKLATWDDRFATWKAGKRVVETEAAAVALAKGRGQFRVERFDEGSSETLPPFTR